MRWRAEARRPRLRIARVAAARRSLPATCSRSTDCDQSCAGYARRRAGSDGRGHVAGSAQMMFAEHARTHCRTSRGVRCARSQRPAACALLSLPLCLPSPSPGCKATNSRLWFRACLHPPAPRAPWSSASLRNSAAHPRCPWDGAAFRRAGIRDRLARGSGISATHLAHPSRATKCRKRSQRMPAPRDTLVHRTRINERTP